MLASDTTEKGTPVSHLTRGSEELVRLKCDACGKRSRTTWNNYCQYQRKRGWTGRTYCQPCAARQSGKAQLGRKCPSVSQANHERRGAKHASWKGGRYIDAQGYVLVNVRSGHNNGKSGWDSYRKEHYLVMEEHLGRKLRSGEVIHHIDGDKTNNRPNNLWLAQDQSKHRTAHVSLQGISFLLVQRGLAKFNRETGLYEPTRTLRKMFSNVLV